MTQSNIFFINVKVPDQEFESIKLAVDHTTTIKQVKTEVLEQLYPIKSCHKARALVALGFSENKEPLFFMNNWTVSSVIQSGIVKEFELIRTDMFQ